MIGCSVMYLLSKLVKMKRKEITGNNILEQHGVLEVELLFHNQEAVILILSGGRYFSLWV